MEVTQEVTFEQVVMADVSPHLQRPILDIVSAFAKHEEAVKRYWTEQGVAAVCRYLKNSERETIAQEVWKAMQLP